MVQGILDIVPRPFLVLLVLFKFFIIHVEILEKVGLDSCRVPVEIKVM